MVLLMFWPANDLSKHPLGRKSCHLITDCYYYTTYFHLRLAFSITEKKICVYKHNGCAAAGLMWWGMKCGRDLEPIYTMTSCKGCKYLILFLWEGLGPVFEGPKLLLCKTRSNMILKGRKSDFFGEPLPSANYLLINQLPNWLFWSLIKSQVTAKHLCCRYGHLCPTEMRPVRLARRIKALWALPSRNSLLALKIWLSFLLMLQPTRSTDQKLRFYNCFLCTSWNMTDFSAKVQCSKLGVKGAKGDDQPEGVLRVI